MASEAADGTARGQGKPGQAAAGADKIAEGVCSSAAAVWVSNGSAGHKPFPAGVAGTSVDGTAWSAVKDMLLSGTRLECSVRFEPGTAFLQGRPRGRTTAGLLPLLRAGMELRRCCLPAASAGLGPVLLVSIGVDIVAGLPIECSVGCASLGLEWPGVRVKALTEAEEGWVERERERERGSAFSCGCGCGCGVWPPVDGESLWVLWEGSQLAGNTGRRLRWRTHGNKVGEQTRFDQRVDLSACKL